MRERSIEGWGIVSWLGGAVVSILGAVAVSGCAPGPPAPSNDSQPPAIRMDSSSPPTSVAVPQFGWDLTSNNVGLRSKGLDCADLPEYSGPQDVPAGTTIREKRITGPMNVSAGNITIDQSCFQPTRVDSGMPVVATTNYDTLKPAAGVVTIRNSEFDGSLLSQQDSASVTGFSGVADLSNNYIHHFGTGISFIDTGTPHDVLVEFNYVTDLQAWGDGATDGNHSDGFTIREFDTSLAGSRKATIRNNRFDCDSGNDTGALFIQTYAGVIDDVTIEGNLLEGEGYQLGLNQTNHPYSNLRATNNRFSGTGYGPAYVQGGSGWDVWEENFLFDPSQPAARGAAVPQP